MTDHADTIRRHFEPGFPEDDEILAALDALERQIRWEQEQRAALLAERQQAIDALREIADERTAGGEQTTSGASRAASIARAALVKLGETR